MCNGTAALHDHELTFQYFRFVAGMRRGRTHARAALLPATQGKKQDAADQQHADNDQSKDQQHADHRHTDQQRKGAGQRVARMTHGGQGEVHVLKIRMVKSMTYERNDGANAPTRQVPMDTVTSAISPSTQAICRLDDIPDGGATAVDAMLADGRDNVILMRQGSQVQAYLNICPHAGRQLDYAPGKFLLQDQTLICAVHGASFNKTDGLCIAGPCKGDSLRSVGVRVQGDEIFLA
jgi:nitrite reductase/ring-hydroxylating ferredoxin subunit